MSDGRAGSPLILGIGNAFRSDDGVGPWIAAELEARGRNARVHAGDGAGIIDYFDDHEEVVLVDATRSGAAPGTVRRFDAASQQLPVEFFHYSTHLFGLAEAVETARALGRLPRKLTVVGIEGACFDAGEGLSEPVASAAAALLAELSPA